MMVYGIPASAKQIASLMKKGEGPTLEFKRSTAELQGAMQSLCAFLNESGGTVLIGVGPDGRLIGPPLAQRNTRRGLFERPLDQRRWETNQSLIRDDGIGLPQQIERFSMMDAHPGAA